MEVTTKGSKNPTSNVTSLPSPPTYVMLSATPPTVRTAPSDRPLNVCVTGSEPSLLIIKKLSVSAGIKPSIAFNVALPRSTLPVTSN